PPPDAEAPVPARPPVPVAPDEPPGWPPVPLPLDVGAAQLDKRATIIAKAASDLSTKTTYSLRPREPSSQFVTAARREPRARLLEGCRLALSVGEDRHRARRERIAVADHQQLRPTSAATKVVAGPRARYPTERTVKLRIASESGGQSRV